MDAPAALAADFCTKLMNCAPRFIVSRVIAINSKLSAAGVNLPRAAIVCESAHLNYRARLEFFAEI